VSPGGKTGAKLNIRSIMKNSKSIFPALGIILAVSLSCTFLKDKLARGGVPANEFSRIAKLPRPGPDGPFVSPGAVMVRKLAETDPSVADFASGIEATERGAIKKFIPANRDEPDAIRKKEKALLDSPENEPPIVSTAFTKPSSPGRPFAMLMMFQGGEIALPGVNDGILVGMMAGQFKSMLAGVEAGAFNKKDSHTETSDGTTTKMDVEFGSNEDGSTVFGLGMNTESIKNGVKVTTEMQAKIEGNDCPNAEGQVQITVKVRMSARSASSGYTQDLTVFIRIQVDDNANISAKTIDIDQATSRGKNGKEVYVQTGQTVKYGSDLESGTISNQRVIQKTDNATDSDVSEAWVSGQSAAYGAAIGAIVTAESAWKGGSCMAIEARSPGSVDPGSGTEIPIKVRHKKDGSDVAAKLDANLVGEASIDPTLIPKTPGTLMYVAPSETGKTATIKLTATSRRGIAKLDLTASTGSNAYRIAGGLDDWYTNTVVCDITKPFTLTGGGITMKLSGGLSGTYEYTGPFHAHGTGTYEISFPHGRDKNGDMVGRGAGTITGDKVYKGTGTENYSVMTVDGPCVDGPVQ
jgi:hypothetical protein